jgi:hypothetical protein
MHSVKCGRPSVTELGFRWEYRKGIEGCPGTDPWVLFTAFGNSGNPKDEFYH